MDKRISLAVAQATDLADPSPQLERGIALGFADGADGAAELADVFAAFERVERAYPWHSWWGVADDAGMVAGLCGFKHSPDRDGRVEIAYFTFPEVEGNGVATGMARQLIEVARANGAREVIAHTLPEENASTRVLDANGFAFGGAVIDPEDGPVWSWRRSLAAPPVAK
ncbi:MAG: N-acetyltransferase [Sphingomonas sp.]|uniref:GNAT family N-acetyltransferase n=1 Tax=Sphingomonas sp. TaxID=28214 RepID=UPI0011F4A61E|nr:GNAT family N-acetyltransferase [Sphingomonas sp.]THD34473.1 MAG: N-acetyltransferase [Sphingomonas sp.]